MSGPSAISTAMKTTGVDTKGSNIIEQKNYNIRVIRIPDVISYINTTAKQLVALVRTNQLTDAECSGPLPKAITTEHTPSSPITEDCLVDADISNISSLDPSLLPVTSVVDRYIRSMLQSLHGYPLYQPEPFSQFSEEYLLNGVNVGDVGFVREDGTFDFLFNICPPENSSINPSNLPDGFCLKIPEHSGTRARTPHPRKTCIFHRSITKTNSGKYRCEGSDGAILELPEGAVQHEATSILALKNLAACHGVEWYKYTMNQGRNIPNGALYLITSLIKCNQWGIAVFDWPCAPGQGLGFGRKSHFPFPFRKSGPKYHWKGSGALATKVANPNQQDAPNQCVFLRGYKIMIRQDIFDNLINGHHCRLDMTPSSPQAESSSPTHVTRQPASILRRLIEGSPLTHPTISAVAQPDEVVHTKFNPSLVHPSDSINAALLSQNPVAKIALTHDDVWCDLLRDNFPELNRATLINIARSYTNMVDKYGCVSLEKTRISDESALGPIQQKCPNEKNTPLPIETPMSSVQEKNDNEGSAILYGVHGDTVTFQLGDGHYTEQERDMIRDHLSNVIAFMLRDINDIMNTMKSHALTPTMLLLPNPQAAYSDHQIENKHRSCVKGTRVPLLQEMADWISRTDEARMLVLSGPAEIGKSTVAYTIAARADALGLLGASFFFSRDGVGRDNGKSFFTAIAYQLCLYNELFAKAIEAALLAKPLSDAKMEEQLEAFILEPLRNILRSRIRPILIVVDGLDECEEEDGFSVLFGLSQLVRDLPTFKVILTTRPQSHFDRFFHSQDDHKIFYVQHIEKDKTYLYPSLSQELAGEQSQEREEGVHAVDTPVEPLFQAIEKHTIGTDAPSLPFSENFNTGTFDEAGPSQEVSREQLQERVEGGYTSDIEDKPKVINDDNLQPSPSQEVAKEPSQDHAEGVHASDIEDKDIDKNNQPYLQPSTSQEVAREQLQDRAEGVHTSDIKDKIINTSSYLQPGFNTIRARVAESNSIRAPRPSKRFQQVRFADTNCYSAPSKHYITPSSTSSIGPFTPPMYVAGVPQPAIPARAPPSRRTSTPAPVSTGTIMHPVLGKPPILRYDLVDPPSGSALSLHSREVVRSLTQSLDEAATSPPVSHLTIYCPHLPWTIRVSASSGHVTVNDVLVTINHNLRRQLGQTEYALLQNGRDRDHAAEAYRDRYRRLRDSRAYDAEKDGGMRRVDFLMEKTRFGGLSRGIDSYGREGWMLSVME